MSTHSSSEVFVAPIVLLVFVICAFFLLLIIIHLIYQTFKKWKNKKSKERKKCLLILSATLLAISSFELSVILTIILAFQVYLLDDTVRHQSLISDKFFDSTHETFEYLTVIFDSLGHLSMLFVFIVRFKYTFSHQIFNQSQLLIGCLYTTLVVLSIISLTIIIYVFQQEHIQILIWESVWEIGVEFTVLFILILFVYNLYKLVKLSVISQLKSGNKTDIDILAEITKLSLERSRSSNNKSSKSKSSNKKKTKNQMTIDGTNINPLPHSRNTTTLSVNKSEDDDTNITQTDDNEKQESKGSIPSTGQSQAAEVLSVMNKMTVLVMITTTVAFITIIGNYIMESYADEHHSYKYSDSHELLDHDITFVMILPVFDMFMTAIMLYLQFNFTRKIYRRICGFVNIVFLKCMIGIIKYFLHKQYNDEQTHSFILNDKEKNVDLELDTKTATTITTAPVSGGVSPTDIAPNDIQLEIQNSMK